jgi:hypothetical protein
VLGVLLFFLDFGLALFTFALVVHKKKKLKAPTVVGRLKIATVSSWTRDRFYKTPLQPKI